MSKSVALPVDQRAELVNTNRMMFAERLRTVMEERGLTVTEVAERMRSHLPPGESFATSNLSHYRQGRSVPREHHLHALALALGIEPGELLVGTGALPSETEPSDRDGGSPIRISSSVDTQRDTKMGSDEKSALLAIEDLGSAV